MATVLLSRYGTTVISSFDTAALRSYGTAVECGDGIGHSIAMHLIDARRPCEGTCFGQGLTGLRPRPYTYSASAKALYL